MLIFRISWSTKKGINLLEQIFEASTPPPFFVRQTELLSLILGGDNRV
jgi:hypothetical protein